MAYPSVERIELPLLQELNATGGVEHVRFLYDRLVGYFPQLSDEEVRAAANGHRRHWRRLVQRAGLSLDERREIERDRGRWVITDRGRRRVSEEEIQFTLSASDALATEELKELSHEDVQRMLVEVAQALGRYAQTEFDYYDVVWREAEDSPRISHVFEVQRKGNVDAALAKLKRAYETQRSRPFLVVASERDTNRAERQMSLARTGPFHEIGRVTTILSFEQLRRLHRALTSVEDILANFFER
jgi:predicted ArsR family transcriptional regulator